MAQTTEPFSYIVNRFVIKDPRRIIDEAMKNRDMCDKDLYTLDIIEVRVPEKDFDKYKDKCRTNKKGPTYNFNREGRIILNKVQEDILNKLRPPLTFHWRQYIDKNFKKDGHYYMYLACYHQSDTRINSGTCIIKNGDNIKSNDIVYKCLSHKEVNDNAYFRSNMTGDGTFDYRYETLVSLVLQTILERSFLANNNDLQICYDKFTYMPKLSHIMLYARRGKGKKADESGSGENTILLYGYTPEIHIRQNIITYSIRRRVVELAEENQCVDIRGKNCFDHNDIQVTVILTNKAGKRDARYSPGVFSQVVVSKNDIDKGNLRDTRLFILEDVRAAFLSSPYIRGLMESPDCIREDVFKGIPMNVDGASQFYIAEIKEEMSENDIRIPVLYSSKEFEAAYQDRAQEKIGKIGTLLGGNLVNCEYSSLEDCPDFESARKCIDAYRKENQPVIYVMPSLHDKDDRHDKEDRENITRYPDKLLEAALKYQAGKEAFLEYMRRYDKDIYTGLKIYQMLVYGIPLTQGMIFNNIDSKGDIMIKRSLKELGIKGSIISGASFQIPGTSSRMNDRKRCLSLENETQVFFAKKCRSRGKKHYLMGMAMARVKENVISIEEAASIALPIKDDKGTPLGSFMTSNRGHVSFDDFVSDILSLDASCRKLSMSQWGDDYFLLCQPGKPQYMVRQRNNNCSVYPLVKLLNDDINATENKCLSYRNLVMLAESVYSRVQSMDARDPDFKRDIQQKIEAVIRERCPCLGLCVDIKGKTTTTRNKATGEKRQNENINVDICLMDANATKKNFLISFQFSETSGEFKKISFAKGVFEYRNDATIDIFFPLRGEQYGRTYVHIYKIGYNNKITAASVVSCQSLSGLQDKVDKGAPIKEYCVFVRNSDSGKYESVEDESEIQRVIGTLLSFRTRNTLKAHRISNKTILEKTADLIMGG